MRCTIKCTWTAHCCVRTSGARCRRARRFRLRSCWQRILFRAEDSYLARIQEAGFDGVYLDRIDAHQEATGHDEAKEAMLALVEDLAEVARAATPGFLIVAQNGEELLEYLRKLPVKERTRVPGLSADRADIIIAGLAIIDGVLRRLGSNRVRVHEGGIRDGILLSMVGDARDGTESIGAKRDPMRAVRRFAKSCAYEAVHAKHVTMLALRIFDQLAEQQGALRVGTGHGSRTRAAAPS